MGQEVPEEVLKIGHLEGRGEGSLPRGGVGVAGKRAVTAQCEDGLRALEQALAATEFTATR